MASSNWRRWVVFIERCIGAGRLEVVVMCECKARLLDSPRVSYQTAYDAVKNGCSVLFFCPSFTLYPSRLELLSNPLKLMAFSMFFCLLFFVLTPLFGSQWPEGISASGFNEHEVLRIFFPSSVRCFIVCLC